jgi:hypothetical protein
MNKHCMIDLETMGTGNNAAIVSIGAVMFDPMDSAHILIDSFHVRVDLQSSIDYGGKVTSATIEWWMDPKRAEARKRWLSMEPVDLASALHGFNAWFGSSSMPTWGNGVAFDNVILQNAFMQTHGQSPWEFHHDRCFRTLKNLVGADCPQPMPVGVSHDALSDATWQAYMVKNIAKHLGLKL